MRKVAFAVLTLLSGFTMAGEPEYSPKYNSCMDKAAGETAGMMTCIDDEIKVQDEKLNMTYRSVVTSLEPTRAKQLQDAQRAWIKFRDANCQFYADPNGGTMAAIVANDCVLSQTASRNIELGKLISNEISNGGKTVGTESVKSKEQDIVELSKSLNAKDGTMLASSPKISPDNQVYELTGTLNFMESESVFVGQVLMDRRYFKARIPGSIKNTFDGTAKVNGLFGIVGKYTENSKVQLVSGQIVSVPVFDALAFKAIEFKTTNQ